MDDTQIVLEFKEEVQRVYPDAKIYFYGSRVTGKHHADSDYDVLVIIRKIDATVRETV